MPSRPKVSMPLRTLQRAMSTVLPAVERLSTVPALAYIRVQPSAGSVEFAASGRELAIRCSTKVAGVVAAEAFTMPGRRTADFARLLEGERIDLTPGARSQLALKCGASDARLAMLSPGEHPQLPPVPSNFAHTMPSGLMDRMMGHVLFAVSSEKDKDSMRGALLEITDGKVQLVATDGHRLARYSAPCPDEPRSWLLPSAILKAAGSRIAQEGDACSVAVSDTTTYVRFSSPQVTVDFSHPLEKGRFPHYRGILPKTMLASVTIQVSALTSAVRRCMSLADSSAKVVRLELSPDCLRLHSADAATGDTDEALPVTSRMQFPPLTEAFRGEYLLDLLSLLNGDVELSFAKIGPNPGLWVTQEVQSGETFECALMGMRVAD